MRRPQEVREDTAILIPSFEAPRPAALRWADGGEVSQGQALRLTHVIHDGITSINGSGAGYRQTTVDGKSGAPTLGVTHSSCRLPGTDLWIAHATVSARRGKDRVPVPLGRVFTVSQGIGAISLRQDVSYSEHPPVDIPILGAIVQGDGWRVGLTTIPASGTQYGERVQYLGFEGTPPDFGGVAKDLAGALNRVNN